MAEILQVLDNMLQYVDNVAVVKTIVFIMHTSLSLSLMELSTSTSWKAANCAATQELPTI
jgi:hypothetical protein